MLGSASTMQVPTFSSEKTSEARQVMRADTEF